MQSSIQVTRELLRKVAAYKDYKEYTIIQERDNGSRKIRRISDPTPELKALQRSIAQILQDQVKEQLPYAHAFIKGRNTLTCVQSHIGKSKVITLDIKDFFPSVPSEEVFFICQFLARKLNLESEVWILYDLLTLHDRLPQGAPSSPVVSNIAFTRYDEQLALLGAYSRYADDLIFSGDINTSRLIDQVQQIIRPFELKADKVKVMNSTERQVALGIILNEKITVPRETKNRLRGYIHYLGQQGKALDSNTVGMLNYIRSISPELAERLWGVYNKAMTQQLNRRTNNEYVDEGHDF